MPRWQGKGLGRGGRSNSTMSSPMITQHKPPATIVSWMSVTSKATPSGPEHNKLLAAIKSSQDASGVSVSITRAFRCCCLTLAAREILQRFY